MPSTALTREARHFSDLLFELQDRRDVPITSESCRRLWELAQIAYMTSTLELAAKVYLDGEWYTPRMWRSIRREIFHNLRGIAKILEFYESENVSSSSVSEESSELSPESV
jgi:hypothetical protein